jgi:hypothetical protein
VKTRVGKVGYVPTDGNLGVFECRSDKVCMLQIGLENH